MIDYSDQRLRETMAGSSKGDARAASYLIEVPEDVRGDLYREGRIRANMTGDRMADGVFSAVRDYQAGGDWQGATRTNTEMLQRERAARF
jgi:hypothetical protein